MSVNGRLEFIDKQMWVRLAIGGMALTGCSKDIEKQIEGIQDSSEKIKGEVGRLILQERIDVLTHRLDYPDTVGCAAITSSGSIVKHVTIRKTVQMRYPVRFTLLTKCHCHSVLT